MKFKVTMKDNTLYRLLNDTEPGTIVSFKQAGTWWGLKKQPRIRSQEQRWRWYTIDDGSMKADLQVLIGTRELYKYIRDNTNGKVKLREPK